MIANLIVTTTAENAHVLAANPPAVDLAAGVCLISGCCWLLAGLRLLLKLPERGCEALVMKKRR